MTDLPSTLASLQRLAEEQRWRDMDSAPESGRLMLMVDGQRLVGFRSMTFKSWVVTDGENTRCVSPTAWRAMPNDTDASAVLALVEVARIAEALARARVLRGTYWDALRSDLDEALTRLSALSPKEGE